jgi:predicted enzyme related to lactoylglutathione lyase
MGERDVVDAHGRFVWYGLMTTDMKAAEAFYASVVGWGTRDASMPGMPYTLFTAGNVWVCGVMTLSEDARRMGVTPRWVGYVGVDDVDATAEQVRRRGGAVHIPPTDIPDISRFSVFTDPQVATLALFKWAQPEQPPTELDMPGRVGWHELLAANWQPAFDFYSAIFGWQKAEADVGPMGTYQLFAAAGQTIGGMFNKPPAVPLPLWLYYFNVRDIDAAAGRVKSGGGEILDGPFEIAQGSWVMRCIDPQGAMFALQGKRSKAVGYFGQAASPDRPRGRGCRWSW